MLINDNAGITADQLFNQGYLAVRDVKYSLTSYSLFTPSGNIIEFLHCWDRVAHSNHPEFSRSEGSLEEILFILTPELLNELAEMSK